MDINELKVGQRLVFKGHRELTSEDMTNGTCYFKGCRVRDLLGVGSINVIDENGGWSSIDPDDFKIESQQNDNQTLCLIGNRVESIGTQVEEQNEAILELAETVGKNIAQQKKSGAGNNHEKVQLLANLKKANFSVEEIVQLIDSEILKL